MRFAISGIPGTFRKVVFRSTLAILFGLPAIAAPPDASGQFYQAIRNNNLKSLRSLLKSFPANTPDKRGATPLMYAAAYGSIDSMQMLVKAGANVNAKDGSNASALTWCASDFKKVQLLVEAGADVNVRTKQGRTPLMVAASSSDSLEAVQYLIQKGADLSVRDALQSTVLHAAAIGDNVACIRLISSKVPVDAKDAVGVTPLMIAAQNGNLEAVKLFVSKGADVNAVSARETELSVKHGAVELGLFTPLMRAAAYGSPEVVDALLNAGAKVNAADVRGITPLMLAVATDHASVETVRLLLARGADPAMKSKLGESATDWAGKFRYQPVMEALKIKMSESSARSVVPAADEKSLSVHLAVERSLTLIERSNGGFFKEGGCIACHAQNLTGMAVGAAHAKGFAIAEPGNSESNRGTRAVWSSFAPLLLQRFDPPGSGEMIAYTLLQLAANGVAADPTTDAMIHNLAAMQRKDGSWHLGAIARPPIGDGDFSRTALSLRALQLFRFPGRDAEFSDRINRAGGWLLRAGPRTTEDRMMQVLGLAWVGKDSTEVKRLAGELIATQHPDGGWPQAAELESDAYATGQVLYALHEAGIVAGDPAYRNGIDFLLRTQQQDGSWHVKSRAPKFQPYFESGFPFGHDQWISHAGTAWAVMGLANSMAEKGDVARR